MAKIIYRDPYSNDEGVVADSLSLEVAVARVDAHNRTRKDEMSLIFLACDDQGVVVHD